ncbi:2-succinyl-5-enolpyruvyl-6-hydroxy-3-cyclohexene-1-carboxylic-acid synthase [Cellulosimicrobium cellulans]|uniref:2-succinyl-5-enolpyruvyl-6-hydroxy-3- cyclohexene-1-carboxylic-acid synthase n=1 Tax=Cellulosimicrobium cellulans TaxID=1710 RepID=UPI00196605D8|nr:2-succinyl-5-enolpyruvyl-6-hydroxy-3-cyclohexene-1-carboxylic-acid synthase [Cellulosimicrobium cellulans]MBN0042447.1 2-succinyl-5-enolpyruvyl-6-hydroxy-3-cyclohexene-1-carboxylic-acid synthase [Cellulosimicrobium cellulans]
MSAPGGTPGTGTPPRGSGPDALLDGLDAQPPAVRSAFALVHRLLHEGVADVVLAPGSRSAPLAYALAAASDLGHLTLHVRVDERAAGFLAVGLSRGAGPVVRGGVALPRPVAVVTTSGTAVANLHPAVLEAHHTGVPIVLLTADRPHELRGTGANQTTHQAGIFGPAVRFAADVPAPDGRAGEVRDLLAVTTRALAEAVGARSGHAGPVHLDLAYREPLVPDAATVTDAATVLHAATGRDVRVPDGPDRRGVRSVVLPAVATPGDVAALRGAPVAPVVVPVPGGRTVVVAGDGAGGVARDLAQARGWPLLAEPSSGAADGPNLVVAHALVLGVDELTDDVEHVVVLGRPTLSRPVQRLLGRPEVEVSVVAPGSGPWPDAARNASTVLTAVPARWLDPRPGALDPSGPAPGTAPGRATDPRWLARWRAASAATAEVVAAATDGTLTDGPSVARAVVASCEPDDLLVVGSSNPVRDLSLVLGLDPGSPRVLANRGLAGIDGTVSTALGAAVAAGRPHRRTRALLGDLTFLHDAGGLLRGPHEPHVDLQLVVVNDDGGSIFTGLEPGGLGETSAAASRTFERVFATPHGANLAQLCAGYGVDHQLVQDVPSLRHALAAPSHGVQVLEVRVSRAERRRAGLRLGEQVREAVRAALVEDR